MKPKFNKKAGFKNRILRMWAWICWPVVAWFYNHGLCPYQYVYQFVLDNGYEDKNEANK